MFRTVPLSIVRSFSLYTQQWYVSYRFDDSWTVPSWSCSQAVSKLVWHIPLLCVQWKTADDGQRNCPKHVEFYFKNKFEKLLHLVGFIIRIYHNAQSHERQNLRIAIVLTEVIIQDLQNTRERHCVDSTVRIFFELRTIFAHTWIVNFDNSSLCKLNVLALPFNWNLFKEEVLLFLSYFLLSHLNCTTAPTFHSHLPPPPPKRSTFPLEYQPIRKLVWISVLYPTVFPFPFAHYCHSVLKTNLMILDELITGVLISL